MKQPFANRWVMIVGACICFACRGSEGPMGISGDDYSSLLDPAIQPRVIFTDPQNQTVGPYDVYDRIQIRFNKIMDVGSLKRAISFSADSERVFLDTSNIVADNGDLITIAATDSTQTTAFRWRVGKSYTLAISDSAMDANGNHLVDAFAISFVPEPYFRVMAVSPKDGRRDVKPGTRPRITFNSPVEYGIISSASISPAIPGNWSLTGDGLALTYVVRNGTSKNLDAGTEYRLSIAASAVDRFGNPLLSAFSSSFTTVPFRVSSTTPLDGAFGLSSAYQLRLTFTVAVDTHTVRNAISANPSTDFIIRYSSSYTSVYISPSTSWPAHALNAIAIDSSLRSATGKNLAPPFVLHFTTAE